MLECEKRNIASEWGEKNAHAPLALEEKVRLAKKVDGAREHASRKEGSASRSPILLRNGRSRVFGREPAAQWVGALG